MLGAGGLAALAGYVLQHQVAEQLHATDGSVRWSHASESGTPSSSTAACRDSDPRTEISAIPREFWRTRTKRELPERILHRRRGPQEERVRVRHHRARPARRPPTTRPSITWTLSRACAAALNGDITQRHRDTREISYLYSAPDPLYRQIACLAPPRRLRVFPMLKEDCAWLVGNLGPEQALRAAPERYRIRII